MNRPAVRNVRALRTERELARARRAHREARERRRVAASRRATLACALLGVLLGTVVASIFTVLPWWLSLAPGALLAGSMAAGHRAAKTAMTADRRESRRVAELETELMRLTGGIGVAESEDEAGAGAGSRTETGSRTGASRSAEAARPVGAGTRAEAQSRARTEARRTAEDEGRKTSWSAGAGSRTETGSRAEASRSAEGTRAETGSRTESETRTGAARPVEREESTSRPRTERADAAARADTAAARAHSGGHSQDGETGASVRGNARDVEREGVVDEAARTVRRNIAPRRSSATEAVSVTPPQGWHPVQVPAPTYTLVASAPRRAIEELHDETGPSAPVPARPTSARPSVPAEVGETLQPPIDLDAVLQRRRAAGE